jgi:hypothetical protein
MNEIQQAASLYMIKFRSVSTAGEFRALGRDVLDDLGRRIVTRVTRKPLAGAAVADDITAMEARRTRNADFWMCRTALYMYAVVLLSLLLQRFWVMHGISLLLLGKMFEVVVKWVVYTLDDDELRFANKYIRGWFRLFLRESEKILTGEAAWKFAMTYSVVANAPTGVSYVRYIVRYKMAALRQEFMSELGEDRFGKRQPGYLQTKLSGALKSGTALQKQLRTSSLNMGSAIQKSLTKSSAAM